MNPIPSCSGLWLASAAAVVAFPLRSHAEVALFDYAFIRDSIVEVAPTPLPVGSLFDTSTGLGHVQMTFAGEGPHSALLFVDHEFSEADNTFFNELGSVSGAPVPVGLSWEIDEPGFSFGDIYDNFLAESLDNSIGTSSPEDVSMALGWNFILAAGETATVHFLLGSTPPSGFYLRHSDPDSGEAIYFSTSLSVTPPVGPVPEGRTVVAGLVSLGLMLTTFRRQRRGR